MADEDDDIAGFLVNEERRAQGRVFSSLDDDPEKGARAIQIADVTGVPPAVVHGDLEHYDSQTKARMSSQLVSTNQFLKGYINSHDLAATVSNDDFGQLDQASQSIQKISPQSVLGKMGEAFKTGFDAEGQDRELKELWNFADSPVWKAAIIASAPTIAAARTIGQAMHLFTGATYAGAVGIGEAATQIGGNEAWGKRLTRDMIQLAQVGLSGQSSFHLHPAVKAQIAEAARIGKTTEMYSAVGKEPPVGTHPFLDKVKEGQAEVDGDNLKEALKESAASATRERSPELYAAFVRQHVGEAKIGISAEKVVELYGEKLPAPDDNILGWVPRISEQLETAKGTGADIEVPLADFLARVDPKIAKELGDHVRMRPEGVTKEEAKLGKEALPEEPAPEAEPVTPVDVVRKTAGLEPFEVFHGSPHQFEAFDISKIGTGEGAQSYGHGLYFAESRAVGEQYRNQLTETTINVNGKSYPHPLDAVKSLSLDQLPSYVAEGILMKMKEGLSLEQAITKAKEDYGHYDSKYIDEAINAIKQSNPKIESKGHLYTSRIKANKEHFLDWDKPLSEQPAGKLALEKMEKEHKGFKEQLEDMLMEHDQPELSELTGNQFLQLLQRWAGEDTLPGVKDINPDNPHLKAEASKFIHNLGIPGIKYLDQGSRGGKDSTFKIVGKDGKTIQSGIHDENAAAAEAKKIGGTYVEELQETHNIVLFDDKLAEITHKNDVPVNPPKRVKPQQLSLDLPKQLDERDPFQRGTLIGVADYDRYLRLIEQRQAEDLAHATKKAEALARKQMTTAWKEDEAAIRAQVVEDLNRQPVFSADTFFRDGTFADEKLAGSHRIGTNFLTPEEQASLPPSFYAKNGLDPDGVAWRFGYSSGQDMINDLAGLHAQREASGKNPAAFRRAAIDAEVSRRMDLKYGEAKKGMLEDAKDQALSDTQIDLLHEETLGMAMKAGVEFELSKADIAAMVKERIDTTLMGDVSSDKMLAAAGRAGRAEASALLKEDYAEAFRHRALKEIDAIMAKQAMELEKQREKFDATAKRFRARSLDSVAQEYTNFIHDILLRVGEPVNRSVQDLAGEIQREGYADLGGFVKGKSDQTFGMLNIPIPDFLLDPNFRKPVDQMTTVEFREMHEAVTAMAKLGRDETKIIRAGEAADRAEVVKEMKAELGTFPLKKFDATAPKTLSPTNIFRSFLASSTNLETLLNRWDRNNPHGPFNKYIVYPLSAAANQKAAMIREMSKPYGDLGPVPNAKKLVTSPLIDPLTITKDNPEGKPLQGFTVGNVQVMIHNAGNEAQWIKFAKGWGADPDALMSWLHQNSTKEMWDRAQQMGDTIFKPTFEKAQTVYHNIYGVAPEKIQLSPIQTPFGEYAGWYHPLIKDPIREVYIDADGKRISGQSKAQMGGGVYDNTDNFHARTTNGYTKSRTNAFYPVDLSPDMIHVRLSQMLHDIAFRAPIIEAEKVFGDAAFRNEVTKHYGEHYSQGLKPYLQGLAGAEGIPSKAFGIARSISEYFRQNTISAYIGFNVYTALKHGPTALVMSMKQVGIVPFLEAMKDLYRRSDDINLSNKEYVDKWSEEVGRRSRHWQDTIIGEHAHIYGEGTLRERVMEKGSWLVAQSDMASVRPTWLAAYRNAIAEGADHGVAIDLAEAAVRKAHGSTAITNQPALVTGGGPMHGWLTSIYGFFGTVMQRRIELAHAINDAYQLGKGGEIAGVAKAMPDITARTFAYVIWPTLVEEWVTGLTTEDKRGWGTHLFTAAAGGLASSVLYLRDITHSLLHGYDPGVGLLSSPLHDIKNLANDLKKGKKMFSKENAGKIVGDFTTVFGEFTGLAPKEVGNLLRAGTDLSSGQAKPKTMKDWQLLLTRGSTKKREVK